ncbi:MAG: arylsulfatase [Planctomycetales bacterium]|nr:arylsulfatase [Planctomycetales bacterium]
MKLRYWVCHTLLWITAVTLVGPRFSTAQSSSDNQRPNIVLIMADDLGFSDLGCYGSEIETPRLDALAAGGLRLSQFYNTAKCHSSRVSLLTGLYCDQAGAESLSRGTTIARQLQHVGYFTAMTGKWHLHDEPTDHGFARYFGHLSGATNFFTGDKTFRLNGQPWNDFGDDFYTTVANTDFAIQFADEAITQQQPFFLYVAYNAPHYPLQPLQKDFEKYRERYVTGWDAIRAARQAKQRDLGLFASGTITDLPRPHYIPAWTSLGESDQRWEADRMAAFAGMVDCLDREIGRLVDHLRKKNAFDNTLFLFVSDNGACPFDRTRGRELMPYDPESYWTYDTGWAHVGNTPFRYYKQNNHEGGIASPAIIHWPKGMTAKSGSIDDTPAHLVDIMATCLDVTGADYPESVDGRAIEPLVGKSLLPLMRGQASEPHPYLYFHFGPNRALRMGQWKVASLRSGPWELYDLSKDRNETHDLAAQFPVRLREMSAKWQEVAEQVDRLPAKQRQPVSEENQDSNFQKNGK